jgi:hypothetical protein
VIRATGGFWLITAINDSGVPTEGMRLPAGTSGWAPIGATPPKAMTTELEELQDLKEENSDLRRRIDTLEARIVRLEDAAVASAQTD